MVEQQNTALINSQEQVREQYIKGVYHPPSTVDDNIDELKQLIEVLK